MFVKQFAERAYYRSVDERYHECSEPYSAKFSEEQKRHRRRRKQHREVETGLEF